MTSRADTAREAVIMGGLHRWWDWIVSHPNDVILALVLALIFAVVMELLDIGSRLRAGLRGIKNKWSEQSVARLRNRIKQLEAYRNRIAHVVVPRSFPSPEPINNDHLPIVSSDIDPLKNRRKRGRNEYLH